MEYENIEEKIKKRKIFPYNNLTGIRIPKIINDLRVSRTLPAPRRSLLIWKLCKISIKAFRPKNE